jgi:hypothetical protein
LPLNLLARDACIVASLILGMGYTAAQVRAELPQDARQEPTGPIGQALASGVRAAERRKECPT